MCVLDRAVKARRIIEAPPYHGSAPRNRAAGFVLLSLVIVLGPGTGGCSMSIPLDSSFFSSKSEKTEVAEMGDAGDVTGSIRQDSGRSRDANANVHPADWSLAAAALREALAKNEEGASIPWQNPATGARGTVTPVASSYVQDGFACRDFLASHVGSGRESWFEGTACRIHRGQWDIRSTRPLKKS